MTPTSFHQPWLCSLDCGAALLRKFRNLHVYVLAFPVVYGIVQG